MGYRDFVDKLNDLIYPVVEDFKYFMAGPSALIVYFVVFIILALTILL